VGFIGEISGIGVCDALQYKQVKSARAPLPAFSLRKNPLSEGARGDSISGVMFKKVKSGFLFLT